MIRAVVFDVEGTTTDVRFVHATLFPLARAGVRAFVARRADDPEVRAALRDVPGDDLDAKAGALERWIDEDRKAPPLKVIQGLLWEEAYRRGELAAHVYPDVPAALARLTEGGLRLFVYSSGSVRAQRLLFAHTAHGDLTRYFEGHFDATLGPKLEAASYAALARAIGLPPAEVAFLSDAPGEIAAARAAGMLAVRVERDGARPAGVRDAPGLVATTFDGLDLAARARAWDSGAALAALARDAYVRGWAYATSGNFSVRLGPARFAVSTSGIDKGALAPEDLGECDLDGVPVEGASSFRPSAETPLHAMLYRRDPGCGAVAHTHSVAATVLSRRAAAAGALSLVGFEMQKAIAGVRSHAEPLVIPVARATQDMAALAAHLAATLPRPGAGGAPAFLLEGHGLTAWGRDVAEARRHVEGLEFLLACALAESPATARAGDG